MSKVDYDRYKELKKDDGSLNTMPFIKLPINSSDKYEYWNSNFSRFDKLAEKYYSNPFYDFLIYYANPEFLDQFDIPDNQLIRIPFPLSKAKADYEAIIKVNK